MPHAKGVYVVILNVMNDATTQAMHCPVGINDCDWVEEIQQLRNDVEELKAQAITDPLTGLYNYRHFEAMLSSELQRSHRSGRPACLIIVDLDYFKRVNDEWGHEAGNSALTLTANVLRSELRPFDILCRYGGEEFAIILPQTTLTMAVKVAERVRSAIAAAEVEFEAAQFKITASLGVGLFQPGDQLTPRQFIDQTDRYLYQAKEEGRNRVCHPDLGLAELPTEVSAAEKAALFASSGDD
jgi:diguanylate cyclase (GGDEF)-like protein